MATNYRSSGYDLDDLFDPYVSGQKSHDTAFRIDGVDLSQRYAHIQFGQKRDDVGYRLGNGMDISNLWAAKGTASYVINGLHGKSLRATDGALTNQSSVAASVGVSISGDGRWSVSGSRSRGPVAQSEPASGIWLPAGAGVGDFQVMFVVSHQGNDGHTVSNTAPSFTAIGSGQGTSLRLGAIPAANTTQRDATCSFEVHLRRISTGSVSVTRLSGRISTSGWA